MWVKPGQSGGILSLPRLLSRLLRRSTVRDWRARGSWLLTGVFAALFASTTQPASAQFTPYSHDPANILEGNWQSCRERDGQYTERVYDHLVNGVGQFEVHMGPRREFAIFKDVQDAQLDHPPTAHLSK